MLNGGNVLSGNAGFWEKAYSDNFETLCSRASRRLTNGNYIDAEDAVSEAFVRVMRYAQEPESIKNVMSYLWTAVKRVWIAQHVLLSRANTDYLEDMEIDELESIAAVRVEPEIQAILEKQEFLVELKMKLGPLSLEEKALIELRLEGHSLEEIAATLGEDIQRTRFRWYRFVARQRYRLAKEKERLAAN